MILCDYFFQFSIKPSITTVPSKNFAEKNIHSKRFKSRYIKPSQLAIHKKIRLTQKAIMVMMLHREFIPHIVHKTDWLTWQMIWQLNADQNWEFLQDEQQLNPHKQISEIKGTSISTHFSSLTPSSEFKHLKNSRISISDLIQGQVAGNADSTCILYFMYQIFNIQSKTASENLIHSSSPPPEKTVSYF